MPKLPILSGKRLFKLLLKHGFVFVRQSGSHLFIESEGGKLSTVIPLHGNEDLGKGILKSILNDLEITVERLVKMLN